jgi:putative membrane-bound dehydrogenase-like protein
MNMKRVLILGTLVATASSLPAFAQLSPEKTAESFKLAPGLESSVWASEPELVNPTNMDIDERGRIWVTEAANYRGSVTRPEGDRILILDDTNHTGKCDSYKVFVQDKKLFAPLGICKLGNKLIVAQSPNVFVYTIDASGDHPVGEPEVLFTGFEGVNHDHGVHAGVFGPDGRFYFNCGNEGGRGIIKHADGQPVIDIMGSEVGSGAKIYRGKPKPKGFSGPREGFAFSCNLDGSDFETLAYNFRNNYELCVDSFGTVWQSDNDDDGNQGCTINYVMEGGNFGYTGPHGSNWGRDQSVFPRQTRQQAHWHQLWPGVVPNMLNTGGGAPCGICVYEGNLLPKEYQGALIHADAGPNVIRAYVPQPSEHVAVGIMNNDGDESALDKPGAGYKAESIDMIKADDHWFRPDDVCVAPDGAVYLADWYDPGVGGHATGDTGAHERNWHLLHGRIYRLAPTGYQPTLPKLDLDSVEGQVAALESPNQARRYLGYTKLLTGGEPAQKALKQIFETSDNPRFRARALWLLARGADGRQTVQAALKDKDADIRITAVRAARQVKMDMIQVADQMLADPSAAVLRELCLAMNFEPNVRAIPMLVKLGDKYDGTDRWYLEAFGIGATGREEQVLQAWEKGHQNQQPTVRQGIEWRLKMQAVPLGEAAQGPAARQQLVTAWWALGPFASDGSGLNHDFGPDKSPAHIDLRATYQGVDGKTIKWEQIKATEGGENAPMAVDFNRFCADRHFRTDGVAGYCATVLVADQDETAQLLVGSDDGVRAWLNGRQVINDDTTRALQLGDDIVNVKLKKGRNLLLCKLRQGSGPSGITVAVVPARPVMFSLDLDPAAAISSPSPANSQAIITKDGQPLPSITELAKLSGDAQAGAKVFANASGANCVRCHTIGSQGGIVGPPLTTIGQKLNKAQLYESILYPSAAIEMGYETWVVKSKSGDVLTGRKVEDTDDHVTLLDVDGKYHDIAANQIDRKVKQNISLMPDGITQALTRQDLVNLVEYLSHLK